VIPEQTYLSQCPSCGAQIDVTALEPFAKISCPKCRQSVRVRRQFDHFVIIKQIGEGGMSRVFEAEDTTLGRRVALKILNRTYSRDATRMAQFQQEALTTARVTHPNVIKLYSVGYDQGHFFIAMELVNGGSLEQRIKRDGMVKEKDALRIGRQVAEGLRAAERMGLLHRDVKPANILFTDDGTAKVVDFGLALFTQQKDESAEIWATPYYVSPEKVIDNQEDFRSDLFSLGASLYHALTGKPPHKANSANLHELRMIKCRRVSLEDSGMPFSPRTIHTVDRLLAFKPDERPASYDAAVDELRLAEGLTDRAVMSRLSFRRKAAISAAAATVLAFGIGWFTRSLTTKPAVTYTSAPIAQKDLTGETITLRAGQQTIADRFLDARKTLLSGDFKEAEKRFESIIRDGARQPTLNWARYNAALCALIDGKRSHAQELFSAIRVDAGTNTDSASVFFRKLGDSMSSGMGLNRKPTELRYNENNEEILGYLAHGLAQWHFGEPRNGAHCLEKFLMGRQADPALDWIGQYRTLIAPYAADRQLVRTLEKPDAGLSVNDARELLEETKQVKSQLKTQGMLNVQLDKRIAKLEREVSSLTVTEQRSAMKEQAERRKRELDQLAELSASLPSLVRGYDYSPAISILQGMKFESPEVQAALDGKLYLYQGASDFLTQLFKDFSTQGWTGHLLRRDAAPLDGRVTAATMREMTMTLSRGALTIPMDQITPEMLIDMAQSFGAQVSDSTDYYRRQELIAIFARVQGLQTVAAHVADQLMEENRGFRSRWLKVLQNG
jgi:serine/threonine protein kinase